LVREQGWEVSQTRLESSRERNGGTVTRHTTSWTKLTCICMYSEKTTYLQEGMRGTWRLHEFRNVHESYECESEGDAVEPECLQTKGAQNSALLPTGWHDDTRG
jgi:hypothetical protein